MAGFAGPGGRLDSITRRVALLSLFGLILTALGIVTDVVLRYFWAMPIVGLEDVTRLLTAFVVAAFFPAALMQGHNITIRFLGKAIGPRGGLWLEALGAAVTLVFFVLVTWQFVVFAHEQMVHRRYTLTLQIPTAPWWWAVTAVMATCGVVQSVVVAVRVHAAVVGRLPRLPDSHEDLADRLNGGARPHQRTSGGS